MSPSDNEVEIARGGQGPEALFAPAGSAISPDDIESKFRELAGDVEEIGNDVRSVAVTAVAIGVVVVVAIAFWLGRRRGTRSATVVEIRRV
jgi:hypothetical protein